MCLFKCQSGVLRRSQLEKTAIINARVIKITIVHDLIPILPAVIVVVVHDDVVCLLIFFLVEYNTKKKPLS